MLYLQQLFASRPWLAAGWTMLHFLWIGSAIALFTAIVRRSLHRANPRIRHAAVLACFFAMAVAPAVVYIKVLSQLPKPIAKATLAPPPTVETSTTPAEIFVSEPAAPPPAPTPAIKPRFDLQALLDPAARSLPLLWAAGMPLALLFFATGLWSADRLRSLSNPIDDPAILDQLSRLRDAMSIRRPILLATCERIAMPILVGILKPAILLPPSVLSDLSPRQLELILLHELAHVRRWDNLVNLCQRLVEAVLFFHPAVWVVSRWLRLEREHCCDAAVLAHTAEPRFYVETLASLAMPGLSPRYAAAAMANHQLVSRVRRILKLEDRTMGISRKAIAVAAATAFTGLTLLAAANARQPGHDSSSGGTPPQTGTIGESGNASEGSGFVNVFDPNTTDFIVDESTSVDDINRRLQELKELYRQRTGNVPEELGVLESRAAIGNARRNINTVNTRITWAPTGTSSDAWSPQQATGAPNVPAAGDDHRAWASQSADGQDEWLVLGFKKHVEAAAIVIHETDKPGAVSRVTVTDSAKVQHVVFEGQDPTAGRDRGVFVIPLKKPLTVAQVRIDVASQKVEGWNEIDAVGLVDAASGETRWADAASASSWYGQPDATPKRLVASGYLSDKTAAINGNAGSVIQRLRNENDALRAALAEQQAARRDTEKRLADIERALGIHRNPANGELIPPPGVFPIIPVEPAPARIDPNIAGMPSGFPGSSAARPGNKPSSTPGPATPNRGNRNRPGGANNGPMPGGPGIVPGGADTGGPSFGPARSAPGAGAPTPVAPSPDTDPNDPAAPQPRGGGDRTPPGAR